MKKAVLFVSSNMAFHDLAIDYIEAKYGSDKESHGKHLLHAYNLEQARQLLVQNRTLIETICIDSRVEQALSEQSTSELKPNTIEFITKIREIFPDMEIVGFSDRYQSALLNAGCNDVRSKFQLFDYLTTAVAI